MALTVGDEEDAQLLDNHEQITPEMTAAGNVQEVASSVGSGSAQQDDEDIIFHKVESQSSLGDDGLEDACAVCKRPCPTQQMVNGGNRAKPLWRCRPCHAALRSLERSAKSQGQARWDQFTRERRLYPQKFAEMVQLCRVNAPGEADPPEEAPLSLIKPGSGRGASSEAARAILRTQVYSKKGAKAANKLQFLSQRQYRCHYKNTEDYSAQEAQAKWERELADPLIEKRKDPDGTIRLPVLMPPSLTDYKDVGSKRSCEDVVDGEEDEPGPEQPESLKRLRSHMDTDAGAFASRAVIGETFAKASVGEPLAASHKLGNGWSTDDLLGKLSAEDPTKKASRGSGSSVDAGELTCVRSLDNNAVQNMGVVKAQQRFRLHPLAAEKKLHLRSGGYHFCLGNLHVLLG